MKKIILLSLVVLLSAMILIPVIIVEGWKDTEISKRMLEEKIELQTATGKNIPIKVYRTSLHTIETYYLEEYVRGVIAAEMPIDFELEALKAQAVAARTYIVKRMLEKKFSDVPDGAVISDSVNHQVFLSDEEIRKRWGLQYTEKISKLNQAINETVGQVITYQGSPILALYFSTSNGYTENAEDYWGTEVPYLKSVVSPWDVDTEKFEKTTTVTLQTLDNTLHIISIPAIQTNQSWIKIIEETAGHRVKQIKIGDKIFSGRELREKLGLASTSFTWEINENKIIFHTKGYGHGVGMSQYGANGMAKEGKTAQEIIAYYYKGVEITDIEKWVKYN